MRGGEGRMGRGSWGVVVMIRGEGRGGEGGEGMMVDDGVS